MSLPPSVKEHTRKKNQSIWSNQKFNAYLGSVTFSSAGFLMQQLIISWILVGILVLPGDEVGIIQATIAIPGLFLMLWGGTLADQSDPRTLLVRVHFIAWIFPLLFLAWNQIFGLSIAAILFYGLTISTATSFSSPAHQAILNSIAGRDLQKAVTASTAVTFLVQMLSLGFAGQMQNIGLPLILVVQSACILIGACLLLRLNKSPPMQRKSESAIAQLISGFRATYRNRDVSHLFLINFLSSVFNAGAFFTVVPFIVHRIYEGEAMQLATVLIIFFLGATVTNLTLFKIMPITSPGKWYLCMQVSRVAILYLLWIEPDWWLFMLAMFAWGMNMGFTTTLSRTIVQESAEPEYRGRILSVYSLGLIGSAPIGALILGNIIEIFGTLNALLPAMLISIILFCYGCFWTPIWRYESPKQENRILNKNSV
ncbi:MAG: MFS transporter [Pseudomonadales bacterium]|nr:MFS transporter [Pseudomonadales bacterium]